MTLQINTYIFNSHVSDCVTEWAIIFLSTSLSFSLPFFGFICPGEREAYFESIFIWLMSTFMSKFQRKLW